MPRPLHARACAPQKWERLSPGVPCGCGNTVLPESHPDGDAFYLRVFTAASRGAHVREFMEHQSHCLYSRKSFVQSPFLCDGVTGLRALAWGEGLASPGRKPAVFRARLPYAGFQMAGNPGEEFYPLPLAETHKLPAMDLSSYTVYLLQSVDYSTVQHLYLIQVTEFLRLTLIRFHSGIWE